TSCAADTDLGASRGRPHVGSGGSIHLGDTHRRQPGQADASQSAAHVRSGATGKSMTIEADRSRKGRLHHGYHHHSHSSFAWTPLYRGWIVQAHPTLRQI